MQWRSTHPDRSGNVRPINRRKNEREREEEKEKGNKKSRKAYLKTRKLLKSK